MIVAILACHQRRELTVRALRSLHIAAEEASTPLRVVLFDDGSTDGTAGAATEILPGRIEVIQGDGSAFWARGMAAAEARALDEAADGDDLLWLNDDVDLEPGALRMMIGARSADRDGILVGATTDPNTGALNYGGYVRSGIHPLRFRHLAPNGSPSRIHTLNGNCVLVSVPVARRMGGIEPDFSHGLADIDYGLRANGLGIAVLLAPQAVGSCPSHPATPRGRLIDDWRHFTSVKGGGHPASMRRVLRNAVGGAWPFWFAVSYCIWWGRTLYARTIRHTLGS